MKLQFNFIKAFLKNPKRIGAFTPSSHFLANKLIEPINFNSAKCIVELGAGTGCVTKKILRKMSKNCTLLCFEIDPLFIEQLKQNFNDPRLKIIQDSAENLDRYLREFNFEKVDFIVSGLPLVILPKTATNKILSRIRCNLKQGGKYTQLQYSLIGIKKIERMFPCLITHFVLLNFPPAFVYVCTK